MIKKNLMLMIGKMWYNNCIDPIQINEIGLTSQWRDDTRQTMA